MLDWLKKAMRGGSVKRYHTVPLIGEETVGEHSFGVAMAVLAITEGKASAELIKAALYHDVSEHIVGDSPFTSKQSFPMLKCSIDIAEEDWNKENDFHIDLNERDKRALKWADMIQLLMFCSKQRKLGNSHVDKVFKNGVKFLNEFTPEGKGPEILAGIIENYKGEK